MWRITWYRPSPRGPVPEWEDVTGTKKAAQEYARRIAQERGWRVLEIKKVIPAV